MKARTPEVFVNARIDNFWFKQEATVSSVTERAAAYVEVQAVLHRIGDRPRA